MNKSSPSPSPSGPSRIWLWGGVATIAVAILFLTLQNGDEGSEPDGSSNTQTTQTTPGSRAGALDDASDPPKTRSSRSISRSDSPNDDEEGPRFPLVDQILSDESIADEVAARRLLQIASDRSLGTAERHEALAHGLMLDFPTFTELAGDPDLPLELATRFVEELGNQPHGSEPQVQGCLQLMNHSESEIQVRAAEQLAFIVENEELSEDPAALRNAAAEFLENRRNAPEEEESDEEDSDLIVPEDGGQPVEPQHENETPAGPEETEGSGN